jgi:hypothetical protein
MKALTFAITERIFANTLSPYRNRELEAVYHTSNIPGVNRKSFFNGFSIVQEIEVRYIFDSPPDIETYKARIFSNNSVLFSMPTNNYSLTMDRDNFHDEIQNNGDRCVLDSIDDSIHQVVSQKQEREEKHLLLIFPEFVELNATKIYDNDDDDEDMQFSLHPSKFDDKYTHEKATDDTGATTYNKKFFIYWKVARTDSGASKRGKVAKKKGKLWSQFLGTGSSGTGSSDSNMDPVPDSTTSS